ncbi:hypothetical protein DIPPA_02151 [Diplonema papillatum]|nr:hypothetical protein DIPPA_02151 [Diplonema papillatum]
MRATHVVVPVLLGGVAALFAMHVVFPVQAAPRTAREGGPLTAAEGSFCPPCAGGAAAQPADEPHGPTADFSTPLTSLNDSLVSVATQAGHCSRPVRIADAGIGPDSLLRVQAGAPVNLMLWARDANGTTTGVTGDMFEVVATSEREMVALTVTEGCPQTGEYRIEFDPRAAEVYTVCLYLSYPSRVRGMLRRSNGTDHPYHFPQFRGLFAPANATRFPPGRAAEWCPAGNTPERPTACFGVAVAAPPGAGGAAGVFSLPTAACTRDADFWKTGLAGSWLKLPKPTRGGYRCEPGYCTGDLGFLDIDGWIFVPRACYLRMVNRETGWGCVRNKSLLFFGDSTVRQTASNLLEGVLGTPVLEGKSYRWHRRLCNANAVSNRTGRPCWSWKCVSEELARSGCMDMNHARAWSGHRGHPWNESVSFHGRMVWGGGFKRYTKPGVRPASLDHTARNKYGWACGKRFCTAARWDINLSLDHERPDFVMLNGFFWDLDTDDFALFYSKVRDLLDLVRLKAPNALVVWNLAHPQCFDDRLGDPLHEYCWRHFAMKAHSVLAEWNNRLLLRRLAADYPEVLVHDRMPMAAPHAHSAEFCQKGMHFGASSNDCHRVDMSEIDVAKQHGCARNWRVDKFFGQVWLNAMCPADIVLSTTSNETIESFVPLHVGNWLGVPGWEVSDVKT